jgi:anti-sigma factor RsiW
LNCQAVIRELSNFIDGDLDGAMMLELERHLNDCADCRLVIDQTKKTINIFCDCEPIELPGEVRNRLHEALRRKLREAAQ